MNRYQELGQAFDAWRKDYFDDYHSSASFARWFAGAFKRYIGAPDEFEEDFPGHPKATKKYVKVMRCVPNEDGETYRLEDANPTFDFLLMTENGFWQFGLALALESGPNVWPKQYFITPVSFALQGDECVVYLFNGSTGVFRCVRKEEHYFHIVFEHLVSLLLKHLEKKQAERVGNIAIEAPPPEPIGFITFPRAPDGLPGAT